MADGFHLAQLNIGRMVAPIDAPEVADFVAALDPVNAIADAAPGFVWRLQSDEGNATSIHVFDDDLLLVNMSVWESLDALAAFVYRSDHVAVMRRRVEWFERMDEAFLVLWWIPAGTIPSVDDAKERLELLRRDGPTPQAFTFRQHFLATGEPAGREGSTADPTSEVDDGWKCPTP
jgi:hypothetical protein